MYRHSNNAALLAMWQTRQLPPPTPDALSGVQHEHKYPVADSPPHSPSDPSELAGAIAAVAAAEAAIAASEVPATQPPSPPPKSPPVTPPRPAAREQRMWRPPKELSECPFAAHMPCCQKTMPCYEYFQDDVESMRRCNLYDSTENTEETRERLKQVRLASRLPCGGNMCNRYLSWWSGWSNSRLTPSLRKSRSKVDTHAEADFGANGIRTNKESIVDVSVVAWFSILKDSLEKMPDSPVYQLAAPQKKDVHQWYIQDRAKWPTLYPSVCGSYFNNIWRKLVPEVKLRRVLRFTKCAVCECLRCKRWDRSASRQARDKALGDLHTHYKFIKGERGYALTKAHRGVMSPKTVLSIAQDGTSQLPNGVPQFAQALHGQEQAHNRLHHHLTLTMVHGMGARCYVTRDMQPRW